MAKRSGAAGYYVHADRRSGGWGGGVAVIPKAESPENIIVRIYFGEGRIFADIRATINHGLYFTAERIRNAL